MKLVMDKRTETPISLMLGVTKWRLSKKCVRALIAYAARLVR